MSDSTPSDAARSDTSSQPETSARTGVRDSVERARDGAHRFVDRVADRAADRAGEYAEAPERWLSDLQQKVARQPIMAVIVATAAGILFGRLLDRR